MINIIQPASNAALDNQLVTCSNDEGIIHALHRSLVHRSGVPFGHDLGKRSAMIFTVVSVDNDFEITLSRSIENSNYVVIEYRSVKLTEVNYEELLPGFKPAMAGSLAISDYLSQITPTRVFVGPDNKVVVVTRRIMSTWTRNYISCVPSIFKWLYDSPVPKEERSIYINYAKNNTNAAQEFEKYLNDMMADVNFKELAMRQFLKGITTAAFDRRKENAKDTYEQCAAEVQNINQRLASLITKLIEYRDTYTMLCKQNSVNKDEEAIQFFLERPNVEITNRERNTLFYSVRDTIEWYDKDEFLDLYRDAGSYLYESIDFGGAAAKALYLCLAKEKGKILASAKFKLTDMAMVRSIQDAYEEECAPNPHIYFYGCNGANEQYYAQFAQEGDWMMAIDQSISATKNINMGDGAVVPKFARWIDRHMSHKCVIDAQTSELISFDDLIERYKEDIEDGEADND